jgi:hypothetical protein
MRGWLPMLKACGHPFPWIVLGTKNFLGYSDVRRGKNQVHQSLVLV